MIAGDKDKEVDPSLYTFTVQIKEFRSNSILLHFSFDNPMQISRGPNPDEMEIEFIDTSLFVSTDYGQTLPAGMKLRFIIPK